MIITIAEPGELKLIEEIAPNHKGPIIITGVGMANVIKALQNVSRNETILNIGYAGSNNIPVGTIVQVIDVQTAHTVAKFDDRTILDSRWPKQYTEASCYTSADFVTEWKDERPAVFDMELAAIASMGFERVISIKKVSDTLNYNEFKEISK